MDNILKCYGTFEDMQKDTIEDLNSSCSLTYLNNALKFYNGLVIEISNHRIFFDCSTGYGVTQISVKLADGTVFMQMTAMIPFLWKYKKRQLSL